MTHLLTQANTESYVFVECLAKGTSFITLVLGMLTPVVYRPVDAVPQKTVPRVSLGFLSSGCLHVFSYFLANSLAALVLDISSTSEHMFLK